jgi:hypothetical protein
MRVVLVLFGILIAAILFNGASAMDDTYARPNEYYPPDEVYPARYNMPIDHEYSNGCNEPTCYKHPTSCNKPTGHNYPTNCDYPTGSVVQQAIAAQRVPAVRLEANALQDPIA